MTQNHQDTIEQAKTFFEGLAGRGMLRIALAAFVVGVFLHVCIIYAVLDDGGGGGSTSAAPGVAGSPAVAATPTPARAADRNSCDAIRGTDYRSETERQWFLTNCRVALP